MRKGPADEARKNGHRMEEPDEEDIIVVDEETQTKLPIVRPASVLTTIMVDGHAEETKVPLSVSDVRAGIACLLAEPSLEQHWRFAARTVALHTHLHVRRLPASR